MFADDVGIFLHILQYEINVLILDVGANPATQLGTVVVDISYTDAVLPLAPFTIVLKVTSRDIPQDFLFVLVSYRHSLAVDGIILLIKDRGDEEAQVSHIAMMGKTCNVEIKHVAGVTEGVGINFYILGDEG